MLLRSSLRSAAVVVPFTTIALAVLGACSSGKDRTPFTDEVPAAASTAEMPEQSAAPPKTPQSGPVTTGSDAGMDADAAPDTCVRAAPSNKCGVVPQCGCTLAETCDVPDSTGNAVCVVAGTAKMGAPCVATAGCAVGLTCLFGTCHAFCGNPGSACSIAKTGSCVQVTDTMNAPVPNLSVCRIACDLRDANACGGTTAAGSGACVLDDKNETDCATAGTGTLNGTCSDSVECGPALVCTVVGAAATGTCKKWCRVGTTDCGGTAVCGGFGTKLMVGAVEYGACP